MARRFSGVTYTLIALNDSDYLKKAVSLLRWRGFPAGKPHLINNGGGGYSQMGRWIVGGEGGGGGSRGSDAQYQTGLGEGFGGGLLGYALINTRWLKLYPLIGGGGRGTGFSAHPTAADESKGTEVNVGSAAAQVIFGLGIELRLPVSRHFSPLIGLRIGYRYRLREKRFGDGSLELPPKGQGEPFIHLLMGLGFHW